MLGWWVLCGLALLPRSMILFQRTVVLDKVKLISPCVVCLGLQAGLYLGSSGDGKTKSALFHHFGLPLERVLVLLFAPPSLGGK